jgi:hypothetical protein
MERGKAAMRRVLWSFGGLAALGVATVVFATDTPPLKANKIQGEFVEAYDPCTAVNVVTGNGFPACTPAVPSDPVCGFGVKGAGKFQAKADTKLGDVKLKAKLEGLSPTCNGIPLTLRTTIRATPEDCGGGQKCTVVDLEEIPLVACIVAKGVCSINTTVNTQLPGTILAGKKTRLAILGVSFFNDILRSFQAGLFVP